MGPVGETTVLRVTVPENPFVPVTVIVVDESDEPAGMVRDDWLADMVKSTTLTVKLVELDVEPDVPLTVTEYEPRAREVRVNIVSIVAPEEPENRVTVGGLNELPGPLGKKLAVRVTVPENPLTLVRVMIDEFVAPATTLREVWLEETVKLGAGITMRVNDVALRTEPLTPLIVTV